MCTASQMWQTVGRQTFFKVVSSVSSSSLPCTRFPFRASNEFRMCAFSTWPFSSCILALTPCAYNLATVTFNSCKCILLFLMQSEDVHQ